MPAPAAFPQLKPYARVTGRQYQAIARHAVAEYRAGKSIRDLAEEFGRSYGWVHRMLTEQGITLRGRGGATRRKSA